MILETSSGIVVDRFKKDHDIDLYATQQRCIKEVVINRKNLFATLPTGIGTYNIILINDLSLNYKINQSI